MTDRDHFAAAALTGLIHSQDLQAGPLRRELACAMAYRWADAMLRERCRAGADCPTPDNAPNHDAAPAARARTDADRGRTDKADSRPGEGTGDTPATHATRGEGSERRECTEPVAWATFYPNGSAASVYVGRQPQHAEPLYRKPPCQDFSPKNLTLTDAERSLLEMLADHPVTHEIMPNEVATLRGLLERLGGEK